MKALVSGQAGMALIIEGEQRYRLLAIEMPDTAEVDITSVRILFDRVSDLIELHDIASERDVLSRLERSWSEDRGVRLAFILLDRHEMRETRASSAESLNELLESREVSEFVANRLYSAPMPDDAD